MLFIALIMLSRYACPSVCLLHTCSSLLCGIGDESTLSVTVWLVLSYHATFLRTERRYGIQDRGHFRRGHPCSGGFNAWYIILCSYWCGQPAVLLCSSHSSKQFSHTYLLPSTLAYHPAVPTRAWPRAGF